MDDKLEAELRALETGFWQAIKDRDVDAALGMVADPCIITGAQGVSKIDAGTFARLLETGLWTLHDFDFHDVKVLEISPDVAVIGYKVRERLTVDGAPLTMDAADASTWVRRNGGWVCALHTESVLGDPYGRDRKA